MKTLEEKEIELIEEFEVYEDWMDRYQYLVDLGGELEGLPDKSKWRLVIHGFSQ